MRLFASVASIRKLPSAVRRWRVGSRHRSVVIDGDLADLETFGLLPAPRDGADAAGERLDRLLPTMPGQLAKVVRYWRDHPDVRSLGEAADHTDQPRTTVYRQWDRFRSGQRDQHDQRDQQSQRDQQEEGPS